MERETFGTFIRRLRTNQGKTIAEIAGLLGFSSMHLSDIERDKKIPTDETVELIGEIYKIDNWILFFLLGKLSTTFLKEFESDVRVQNIAHIIHASSDMSEDKKNIVLDGLNEYAEFLFSKACD